MRRIACRSTIVCLAVAGLVSCQNRSNVAGLAPFASGPYASNANTSPQAGQFDAAVASAQRQNQTLQNQIASLTEKNQSLTEQLRNSRTHAKLQDDHLRTVSDRLKQSATELAEKKDLDDNDRTQFASLDRINQEKERQLAAARQDVQRLEAQLIELRNELQAKDEQLARSRESAQTARQQLASDRRRGGALITPNASTSLPLIEIPDVDIRRDGDVVRIRLPADGLFEAGSVRLLPAAGQTLDQIAAELARSYPYQRIGVEGHTSDAIALGGPWRNSHHLSSAESMGVYEYLVRDARLNPSQLHVVGHGGNHPIYSNATETGRRGNHRVEIVVYPETFGDSVR